MTNKKVMRKQRENVRFDRDKTCYYCGNTVKNGEGSYTDERKLLICRDCKPKVFTPLNRVQTGNISRLESTVY